MNQIVDYQPKTDPYGHQRLVLEKSWSESSYGYLMEMGTGKSKVVIDNTCMLREKRGLKRMLIIAPKGTYANWFYKEIPAHMPDRHRNTTIVHLWQGGNSRTELQRLPVLLRNDDTMKILIVNTEALSMSVKAMDFAAKFVKVGDCIVVVDESSTIKNPKAIRTKKIIQLGRLAKWRRIATGSPVTRSPLDLWAQFEFLDPGSLGYKSYFTFRAHFAIVEQKEFGGRKVDIVVGHRNTDELSRLVAKRAFVIRKEDCLDLPPKIYAPPRYVALTSEQEKLYTELRDWTTAEIDNGKFVTATQIMPRLLRLYQIICGHVVDEQGGVHDVPTNRLDELQSVTEETTGRNIIWCNYRRDVDKVIERLTKMGRRVVRYDGSCSDAQCEEAIYQFQGRTGVVQNGQVVGERICPEHLRADDFVGTPHKGGYGITLTAASTVIYYSHSYDLEKRLQSEDRPHRIGQTQSVLYIDLMAKGTIEESIIKALERKEEFANLIMDGPARIRNLLLGS